MRYKLKVLSPVHIGTGTRLSSLDGAYFRGRWYRISLDKVLRAVPDQALLSDALGSRDFSWETWLRGNLPGAPLEDLSSYSLKSPALEGRYELREAVKTSALKPYIPGSSVKGAIRTALLWRMAKDDPSKLISSLRVRGSDRRERADDTVEAAFLGGDPHYDILRALRVRDSSCEELERMEVGLVWVYTLRDGRLERKVEEGREHKTFVEWLTDDAELEMDISVDEDLLSSPLGERLGFAGRAELVRGFAEVCNDYAREIISRELEFYSSYGGEELRPIAAFYQELEVPEDGFLLNIGWGGGWETKTLGGLLEEVLGEDGFRKLRTKYSLGRNPRTGRIDLDAPFPKTRRIAYDLRGPYWPLGWVRLSTSGSAESPGG
ncbi:MAG: type III-A CRISPR-associated RAMP protein Csm5 [Candidatus Latescibacterota bacterium]|nr:MAG: type III-A CRISPR-associated RAMP protein Csm5 [Candidatus Latescibacterota bacterium]